MRSLRGNPRAAAAIVIVTASGLGLATAMFSLADPYVLRPLPYKDPHQLVALTWHFDNDAVRPTDQMPTLRDWQARSDLFVTAAAVSESLVHERLVNVSPPRELSFYRVSGDFFDVLGLPKPPSVSLGESQVSSGMFVLSPRGRAELFRSGGPSVLDRESLKLDNGDAAIIAGAFPEDFVFPSARVTSRTIDAVALYAPSGLVSVVANGSKRTIRKHASLVIARTKPGVTLEAIHHSLSHKLGSGTRFEVEAERLSDLMTRGVRRLAAGAVGVGLLILLVSAANSANLFAVRWVDRKTELTTRLALGAAPRHLVRLLAFETTLLMAAGLGLGVVFANFALKVAELTIPAQFSTLGPLGLSWRSFVFALLAATTVVVVGVVPTAVATWRSMLRCERPHSRGRDTRLRLTFIALQSGVAMILACGATLVGWSYLNLIRQHSGYDPKTVLVSLRQWPERDPEPSLQALRQIPGLKRAAAIHGPIVEEDGVALTTITSRGKELSADVKIVTPEFFSTVGTPIVAGRDFNYADLNGGAVIVDEGFASRHWPGQSPLGAMLNLGLGSRSPQAEVVGVVRSAFDRGLVKTPTPTLYSPVLPRMAPPAWRFVLSLEGGAVPSAAIRSAIAHTNRGAVVSTIQTLGERLNNSIRDRTFAALVLSWFAVAGVTISLFGVVGLISFILASRAREVGIRLALGAGSFKIWSAIVSEIIFAASLGIIGGVVSGHWMSVGLRSLVFGIEVGSWIPLVTASIVLLALVVASSILPIVKVSRRNLSDTLRVG